MTECPIKQEDLDMLTNSYFYAEDENGDLRFHHIILKIDYNFDKNHRNESCTKITRYDILLNKTYTSGTFSTNSVLQMIRLAKKEINNDNIFDSSNGSINSRLKYYIFK